MKERTTRTLLQTVALVGAMATGATAFGDYWKEWSATGKGYWDVDSNWTTGSGTTLDDYRVGATGAEIAFDKAITDDTANLYVFAGSTTFSADDSAYGLTKNNWLCVGVWFGGEASTTFASGTYSFSEINIGRWTASGTDEVTGETVTWPCNGSLTITGGATVSAPNIWVGNTGIDGTLTLNGGTLSAGYVGGTGTLAVGENGGTFDNAEAATIATAITGTGTLTKTGAGTLTITGDTSGFTGTITVAEGAGSVTVAGTTIEAGQTVSFYSTCRWIGTGGDNYWSTPDNWSTRNVPGENDAVEFTVAANVMLTGDITASDIRINAPVTISGGKTITLNNAAGISGSGTLTLAGVTIKSAETTTVQCNLVIADATSNTLTVGKEASLNVSGNVTGTGKVVITQATGKNNADAGVKLTGSWADFAGEVQYLLSYGTTLGTAYYQQRATDTFTPVATSAKARWDVYTSQEGVDLNRSSGSFFATAGETYYFGTLKMRLPNSKYAGYTSNVTIEAGALDEDSFLLASWYTAVNCGVNWVAPTAKFSNYAKNTAFINIKKGGYVEFGADGVPGAINFQDVGGIVNIPADDALAAKVAAAISFIDEGAYAGFGWYDAENEKTLDLAAKKAVFAGKNIAKQGSGTLYLDGLDGITLGNIYVWGGTLVLPHGVKADTITVADGARLVIDLTGAVNDEVVFEWTSQTGTIDYRNKSENAEVTTVTDETTTKWVLSRSTLNYTWNGGASGEWLNPGNWLVGGDPTAIIPTADDSFTISGDVAVQMPSGTTVGSVTVDGGTLTIPVGITFAGLTLENGANVAIDTSASLISSVGGSATLVTLPTDTTLTAASFSFPGNYEASFEGGVLTATRVAAAYVWTGAADTNWSTSGNWSVGGKVYEIPSDADTVEFPATAQGAINTITLDGDKRLRGLTMTGDTRMVGGAIILVSPKTSGEGYDNITVEGQGTLYLGENAGLKTIETYTSYTVSVNIPKLVIEGTENRPSWFTSYLGKASQMDVPNMKASDDTVFEGTGVVKIGGSRATWAMKVAAWSAFKGKVILYNDNIPRNGLRFNENAGYFPHAKWEVYSAGKQNWTPAGSTFTFGELSGAPRWDDAASYNTATIYTGSLNTDFTLGGSWRPTGKAGNILHKEGTGTMTFTGKGIKEWFFDGGKVIFTDENSGAYEGYTFNGGSVVLTNAFTADISGMIKNSTGPIAFDDGNLDRIWESQIADSNVGGFAKSGTGTLTLSEMPLYTGITSIMDGKIVFPKQLGEADNKEIILNPLSAGTYENAILTGYAYPAGTVLDGTETADDVRNEFAIDVSGVAKVDLSAANETIINALKTNRQWILASSAEGITGFRRGRIELVMPAKPDDVSEVMWQWTVGVVAVKGGYALAVMPESNPTRIIIR